MKNKKTLEKDLKELKALLNDDDTPAEQKATFRASIENIEAELATLEEKPKSESKPEKKTKASAPDDKEVDCEAVVKEKRKQKAAAKLAKLKAEAKKKANSAAEIAEIEEMTMADFRPKKSVRKEAEEDIQSLIEKLVKHDLKKKNKEGMQVSDAKVSDAAVKIVKILMELVLELSKSAKEAA